MRLNPAIFATLCILLFILTIWFGPILRPYDLLNSDIALRLMPPSWEYPFGMDSSGNDILGAILVGGRATLTIAFVTVVICTLFGTMVGIVATTSHSLIDQILMRLVDLFMTFPGILPAMVIASILEPSISSLIISMSITGWTATARLVRAQAQNTLQKEYIQAANALGCSKWHLILKHILPSCLTPLIVHATFSLSSVILTESSLTFLGFGPQNQYPSWGALLNEGRSVLIEAPHISLFPGLCILTLVLCLNFVGDGLRDYFDPKQKSH